MRTFSPRLFLSMPQRAAAWGFGCRLLAVFLSSSLSSTAPAPAAPLVPGYERFGRAAADPAAQIEAGLLLAGELGCVNCHAGSEQSHTHLLTKTGPLLEKVGERIDPAWLVDYLKNPTSKKPGTTMPDLLAGILEEKRAHTATALAHFLASTGPFQPGLAAGASDAIAEEGAALYARVGCQVCHGALGGEGHRLPDQIPLGDLAEKWSPAALDAFIKNPLEIRPAGRMPGLPLDDMQRRHIVASLLVPEGQTDERLRSVVAFSGEAWRGKFSQLPDFLSLGAAANTGPVTAFNLGPFAGGGDGYAVRLSGSLHVRTPGIQRFYLASDDGSRLIVSGKKVIDNDGIHPRQERNGEIDLAAGVHRIVVEYFEGGGGAAFNLDVAVPGQTRQSALAWITPEATGVPPALEHPEMVRPPWVLDADLVAQGRLAFETIGCANCHQLPGGDGMPVRSTLVSPAVAKLAATPAAGCLAPAATAAGVPRYALDDAQREALTAALGWLATPRGLAAPAREQEITRSLTALNCYACHVRDGRGGTIPAVATFDEDGEPILKEATRDALFQAIVQEIGDEGRLPPTLTGVGDKLTREFLGEVLVKGGIDRRLTMHTLMPKWAPRLAEPLADLMAQDPHTSVPIPALDEFAPTEIHDQGRKLVGSKGLGCIKCHSFAGDKGQSLGVIDMTRMPKRLRHEWFLAYVANPQQFRPGTRMPASWPEGKAFFPEILDGSAAGQIEAVWRYISLERPRLPTGLGSEPIELEPKDRPIFYRNFIEGGGPRGIGVGFPGGVNIAWDAEKLRTALVWRGGFIDARRHWSGRGEGWQPPLGDGIFTPDAAASVELLPKVDASWPTDPARSRGGRFRGYALDAAGQPIFSWSLAGLTVRESFAPLEGAEPGLKRSVEVTAAAGPPPEGSPFFRVATATTISAEPEGWLRLESLGRVRVSGADLGPVQRVQAEGKTELRYPIRLQPGTPARFVEEISW